MAIDLSSPHLVHKRVNDIMQTKAVLSTTILFIQIRIVGVPQYSIVLL